MSHANDTPILINISALICDLSNPCLNGATCSEAPGDTVNCDCAVGYAGDNCETGANTQLIQEIHATQRAVYVNVCCV